MPNLIFSSTDPSFPEHYIKGYKFRILAQDIISSSPTVWCSENGKRAWGFGCLIETKICSIAVRKGKGKLYIDFFERPTFKKCCNTCSFRSIYYCGNQESERYGHSVERDDLCLLWGKVDWVKGQEEADDNPGSNG